MATDGRILARLFLIVNSVARICGKIKLPCGQSWDCLGLDEDQNMDESNEAGTINLEEARRMDADSVVFLVAVSQRG